jgi:hypothetical protein
VIDAQTPGGCVTVRITLWNVGFNMYRLKRSPILLAELCSLMLLLLSCTSKIPTTNFISKNNLSQIVDQYLSSDSVQIYSEPRDFAVCGYKEIGFDENGDKANVYLWIACTGMYKNVPSSPLYMFAKPIALRLVKQGSAYQIQSSQAPGLTWKPTDPLPEEIFPPKIAKTIHDFGLGKVSFDGDDLKSQVDAKFIQQLKEGRTESRTPSPELYCLLWNDRNNASDCCWKGSNIRSTPRMIASTRF